MKFSMTLSSKTTLEEIITAIDVGGVGFLALVDDSGKLVGVVTDGDIRRAILRKSLTVESVVNYNPLSMPINSTKEEIVGNLKKVHRRHMPLVDDNGCLAVVFSLDEVEFVSRSNVVVIMAGGMGTRLGELTKDTPKPMLVVGDRPMLQHLVEQFRDQGFFKFILCLNYKKEVITDYFGDGTKFGVNIDYVFEDKRLGTAGALSLLNRDFADDIFVINADVMVNIDFNNLLAHHQDCRASATMCVRSHEIEVPYGVINSNVQGQVESLEEKPKLAFNVNAGVYVLAPQVIEHIPKDQFYDITSLFELLVDTSKKAVVYQLDDYWVDIGRVDDLKRANKDLMATKR